MKTIIFSGKIWRDSDRYVFSRQLDRLLKSKDTLIQLKFGTPPYEALLGVPHQAAIGEPRIAEHWVNPRGGTGRSSDENAASIALITFISLCNQNISCKVIIVAHATDHDPNKDPDSPYCKQVFSENTNMLVEFHGSSKKRKRDIEISSGTNDLISALKFGRCLATKLDYRYSIIAQSLGGSKFGRTITKTNEENDKLTLPALKTTSLAAAQKKGIPALHIEAKPRYRIPDNNRSVSADGYVLGNAIANCIAFYV